MLRLEKGLPLATHSERKKMMWIRLSELDQQSEFWLGLISFMIDGGFLSKFADSIDVSESILRNWIRGNAEREKDFVAALKLGKAARVQRVLEATYEVATKDNDAPVTRAEQLKAAEILLKTQNDADVGRAQIGNLSITFVAAPEREEKVVNSLP